MASASAFVGVVSSACMTQRMISFCPADNIAWPCMPSGSNHRPSRTPCDVRYRFTRYRIQKAVKRHAAANDGVNHVLVHSQ